MTETKPEYIPGDRVPDLAPAQWRIIQPALIAWFTAHQQTDNAGQRYAADAQLSRALALVLEVRR